MCLILLGGDDSTLPSYPDCESAIGNSLPIEKNFFPSAT